MRPWHVVLPSFRPTRILARQPKLRGVCVPRDGTQTPRENQARGVVTRRFVTLGPPFAAPAEHQWQGHGYKRGGKETMPPPASLLFRLSSQVEIFHVSLESGTPSRLDPATSQCCRDRWAGGGARFLRRGSGAQAGRSSVAESNGQGAEGRLCRTDSLQSSSGVKQSLCLPRVVAHLRMNALTCVAGRKEIPTARTTPIDSCRQPRPTKYCVLVVVSLVTAGCTLRERQLEPSRGVRCRVLARGPTAAVLLRPLEIVSLPPPEPEGGSAGYRQTAHGQEVNRPLGGARGSFLCSLVVPQSQAITCVKWYIILSHDERPRERRRHRTAFWE